jgi:hypothetical protein
MTTRMRISLGIALAAAFLIVAVPAFAGKGHGGSGGTTGGTGGSVSLLPLYTHSGGPVIGDWVTFSVSTSAAYPYVRVDCYQGSTLVLSQTKGFFPAYPWGQNYQLGPTSSWTSGSASCVATLFTSTSKGSTTLGSTTFTVSG